MFNPTKKFSLDKHIATFFAGYTGTLKLAGKGYDNAFVWMTPELAAWIRDNRFHPANRNPKVATQARIGAAILQLEYYGEAPHGFSVGEDNHLYDGHNRNRVFIVSQFTGWVRFTFGVRKEVLMVLDTGDARSDLDLQIMTGQVDRDTGKREVEACRWLAFIEKGVAPRKYTTNYTDFRVRYKKGLAWLRALPIEKKKQPLSSLVLAALVYMYAAYEDATSDFYSDVVSFKLSGKPVPPSALVGSFCVDLEVWMAQNNQEARRYLQNSVMLHVDAAHRGTHELAHYNQMLDDRRQALKVTKLPMKAPKRTGGEAKTG